MYADSICKQGDQESCHNTQDRKVDVFLVGWVAVLNGIKKISVRILGTWRWSTVDVIMMANPAGHTLPSLSRGKYSLARLGLGNQAITVSASHFSRATGVSANVLASTSD